MFLKGLRMAFRPWKRTPRSSTRCRNFTPLNAGVGCAGTTPPSRSPGQPRGASSRSGIGVFQTFSRKEGLNTVELANLKTALTPDTAGQEMYELIAELYPLCRSITGDGLRKTLDILKSHLPLDI